MQNEQNQTPPIKPILEPQNLASQGDALQNQSVSGTKKSLPKWPLIIVAIILLSTLLIGTYMLGKNMGLNSKSTSKTVQIVSPTASPTPDPTANWKTYTNNQYGFTIKYPSTFQINDSSSQFPPFTIYLEDKSKAGTSPVVEGGPNMMIAAKENKSSLDNFIDNPNNNLVRSGTKTVGLNNFVTVREEPGAPSNDLYLIKQGNYIIEVTNVIQFPLGDDVFNQILSTFKFTDQATANPDTASWKSYSSTDFSFMHPQDWTVALENDKTIKISQCTPSVNTTGKSVQFCEYINLITNTFPEPITLNDWANSIYNNKLPSPINLYPKLTAEGVSIGGQPGLSFSTPGGSYNPSYVVTIYKNKGYLFEYYFSDSRPQLWPLPDVLEGIVSTFKFTQ